MKNYLKVILFITITVGTWHLSSMKNTKSINILALQNIYQRIVMMSDLLLANVEASARGEIEDYGGYVLTNEKPGCYVCRRDNSSNCNVHDQTTCD